MNDGYFITGTDTGVGKTVVSAILCSGMRAAYWKPIQTGAKADCDSRFLEEFSSKVFPELYKLREPLSPHAAAQLEGVDVSLRKIVSSRPSPESPLIIEGAGGVLVPLNDRHFMIDLISEIGFPTIVVSRSTLGTINHTLLTLEALRQRKVLIAGVVLVGPRTSQNRYAIETHGRVPVLGEVLPTRSFSRTWMVSEFQKFNLPENSVRSRTDAGTFA
jgi:dethiobiotin synthase